MNGHFKEIGNVEKTKNKNAILDAFIGSSYYIFVFLYVVLIIVFLKCLQYRINGNALVFEELSIIFLTSIVMVCVFKLNILIPFMLNVFCSLALLFFYSWVNDTGLPLRFFLRWL